MIRESGEEKKGSLESSSPVLETQMNDPNESEMNVTRDPVL